MNKTKKIYINSLMTAEQVLKPHIITSEILNNKNLNLILSLNHEGWDLVYNGTENLVKEICDYNSIDYKKIKFESSNYNPNLTYFDHIQSVPSIYRIIKIPNNVTDLEYNKYGLFVARPTNERLHVFLKHVNWEHNNLGLATFHFDPSFENEMESGFVNFLVQYNEGWKKLLKILPYSDFGDYSNRQFDPDRRRHYNVECVTDVDFWTEVYKKISIEIVCETVVQNESFYITEKTIRPILYKRLFLTVAPKGYEKKLKELGFDIFDDIIDKTYDDKNYHDRVEHVYGSLDYVLRNFEKIKNSKEINQRLEKNKERMTKYVKDQVNLLFATRNK